MGCECRLFRSVVPMIGQLMRVHLAIPDLPIEAKIRPKVQPGPAPCSVFFPEAEDPITLHPGLWILRLPYPFTLVSSCCRLITHSSRSQCVVKPISDICDFVCLSFCVRALKGKWLELSTSNLVHIYSLARPQHAMTIRSEVKVTGL